MAHPTLRQQAVESGVKVVPLEAPAQLAFGRTLIDVLAPLSDYIPGDIPKNNDSLVLRIRYGSRSFLLTGDAERPIERRMIEENEVQPTDVLKVAHHGSRTSSTEDFLSAAHPAFAIISVGVDNSYGHPNRDVLERLTGHHAEILRTDQRGLVTQRLAEPAQCLVHVSQPLGHPFHRQAFDIGLRPHRKIHDHPAGFTEPVWLPHCFGNDQDVAEQDGGVKSEPPDRLERDLDGQVRRLGHLQKCMLFL